MSRILFACDLDNTLIHSYKHKREGDICIEWIDGKQQGYMSAEVCSLLNRVRQLVDFVPVTTRSMAQYQRIVWPQGGSPRLAITTHGAVLLKDGKADEAWNAATALLADAVMEDLQHIVSTLEATGEYLRCRMVDQAYAFVYCRNDSSAVETAMSCPVPQGIYRVRSGKKIYFIPVGIDKGNAVTRFGRENGHDMIICAGDSDMDVPMLSIAGLAFAPASLQPMLPDDDRIHICSNEGFAIEMLQAIERFAKENG